MDVADAAALQSLFDRCSEFFELTEGAAGNAADELRLRAPGKSAEETFCFGAFRDDRLVGFIHLTRDHPKPNEWWLGLLLLDPDVRGAGLGVEVHEALRSWSLANDARVMWLGVLEQNPLADRFWRRLGYVERERQPWVSPAGLRSTIILMSRPLATESALPS
jgi:GNAT superfamily N-acetyltransferase